MVRKALVFAVIVLSARIAFSQSTSNQNEINSEFEIATNLFDAHQFPEALKIFRWVVAQPENPKSTVSALFTAKILIEQKDFHSAEEVLLSFFKGYSASKYLDEAELLYAETLNESGRKKEAANFLIEDFEKGNNKEFQSEKKKFLSSMLDDKFSVEEIEALLGKELNNSVTPFLLSSLVKKNLLAGSVEEAKKVFTKLQKDFPGNSETIEAERQFGQPPANTSEDATHIIVCLLPITNVLGVENSAAGDVLEGIKYAMHEYNSLAGNRFALLLKDTKRDSTEIHSIVKEIEDGKNYSAVIGPLFSDETRLFLEASKHLTIPLISPTATDENLQSGNKFFYQANTSMELHGKVMAQYLYYVENKRSIAALFPQSGNANVIGKSFVSEFKNLGGKVLGQTYLSKKLITESLVVDFKKGLKRVEGIFLPLNDNGFIPVILSAMVKNEIDLPIYGNQDWFTTKGLETSSTLSEKLTFTSDSFIDFDDEDVATFSRKYFETAGREVNLNNLYGYDAAKYLLKILTFSERNGITFEEAVAMSEPFIGVHNSIDFKNGNVNSYLNIVRFHQGKFELVERFKYKPQTKK